MACYTMYNRLQEKNKTPEQRRKLQELENRLSEKKITLQLDREITEFKEQIDKMVTPELERECYRLYSRLDKKKKTTEQKKKLQRLYSKFVEKRKTMEQDSQLTERMYTQLKKETQDLNRRLTELIDRLHEKTLKPKQKWKLNGFIHRLHEDTQDLEMEFVGGAAGEGTSGPSSTPLLSTALPAGLETSSPPAPSSETQPAGLETSSPPAPSSETPPAEETTPLMSSESPEPTRDQQEHTSRTTTPDGHDDDQSLGPEVIRRDIGASQSIPSTSQSIPSTSQSVCRSGAGEGDIEMGPVPGSDHKSHKST